MQVQKTSFKCDKTVFVDTAKRHVLTTSRKARLQNWTTLFTVLRILILLRSNNGINLACNWPSIFDWKIHNIPFAVLKMLPFSNASNRIKLRHPYLVHFSYALFFILLKCIFFKTFSVHCCFVVRQKSSLHTFHLVQFSRKWPGSTKCKRTVVCAYTNKLQTTTVPKYFHRVCPWSK